MTTGTMCKQCGLLIGHGTMGITLPLCHCQWRPRETTFYIQDQSAEITEFRERCAFYERTNAEQGKLLNAAVAERDRLKELHRSAVIEAQKSFSREKVCLEEMARCDARANKPRTSPQLGWDALRRQLAACQQERDECCRVNKDLEGQLAASDALLADVEKWRSHVNLRDNFDKEST